MPWELRNDLWYAKEEADDSISLTSSQSGTKIAKLSWKQLIWLRSISEGAADEYARRSKP